VRQVRTPGHSAITAGPVQVVRTSPVGKNNSVLGGFDRTFDGRAETEHSGVFGLGRIGIDEFSYGRADAVGADQDIGGCRASVCETCRNPLVVFVDADKPFVVFEWHTCRYGVLVQQLMQLTAVHQLHRWQIRQTRHLYSCAVQR